MANMICAASMQAAASGRHCGTCALAHQQSANRATAHRKLQHTRHMCTEAGFCISGSIYSREALHFRLTCTALQQTHQSDTRLHSAPEVHLAPGGVGGSGTQYCPILLLICKADMQTRAAPPEEGLWVIMGKKGRELLGLCKAQGALSGTRPPMKPQRWDQSTARPLRESL